MLTNETLLAIVHGKVILGMNDVRPMAEELLTFRSIRDAGDEGVTLLAVGLSNDMSCGGIGVMNSILKLRDIAIARGQQLREAREETTEDMEAIACLSGDVERLTAERDEMVGLLKWLCINTNIRLALEWCGSSPKIKRILEIVEEK